MGSRRSVEEFITSGRVKVNGKVCRDLSTSVIPDEDKVTLDGKPVSLPKLLYYKYYKPRGVVSTIDDPHSQNSVGNFLRKRKIPAGVVPAGRLDKDSEGLLILSNDGDLLQRIGHPSHEVEKVYMVLLNKRPTEKDLYQLRRGIQCEDFMAKPKEIIRMGPQSIDEENPREGYWVKVILIEGHKREIREMMRGISYRILRLARISQGNVTSSDLEVGEIKPLTDKEIAGLEGRS
jgi:23S rRNA pseudouridine2605 synthase